MKSLNYLFHESLPEESDVEDEILQGLKSTQKKLSPKYFYDKTGSELFDQICQLPEYYPTRTEIGLLRAYGDEFSQLIGPDSMLIELGSGSSIKIRLLLESLRPKIYVPIDISKKHLQNSAKAISDDYPWLKVHAVCADYSQAWSLPYDVKGERVTLFFPGSSIGNFEPERAITLLQSVGKMVGHDVGLILGVDLKKNASILNAAYNDSSGVTSRFNKNILARINRDHGGNFNLDRFNHNAFYNSELGRIEMHLVSDCDQLITVEDATIRFKKGETIHTENSYKYSIEDFITLAAKAGLESVKYWQDNNSLFSIHYMRYL